MNPTQKEKINRFLMDKTMAVSVYEVLLQSFLKPKPHGDVHILAASRVAIDLLQEGWRELEKYREKTDGVVESVGNVGL